MIVICHSYHNCGYSQPVKLQKGNVMENIIKQIVKEMPSEITEVEKMIGVPLVRNEQLSTPFYVVYNAKNTITQNSFHSLEVRLPVSFQDSTEVLIIFDLHGFSSYNKKAIIHHFGNNVNIVPPRPRSVKQTIYYVLYQANAKVSFGFDPTDEMCNSIIISYKKT